MKLKSDTAALGQGYNTVTRNTFGDQRGYSVRNEQVNLGSVCGNQFPVGATWYGATASAATTAPCTS